MDERDGELAGYAYAGRTTRSAYRWATDVTAYVSERHQRRGRGARAYERLFELVRAQGFTMACAGITLPNEASVGLHEAFGFEPVGVYRRWRGSTASGATWAGGSSRCCPWAAAARPAEPEGRAR